MAYNAELQLLRELVRFLVEGQVCYFCKLPLRYEKPQTYGHRSHTAFRSLITVHHLDGNHQNNERSNLALSHRDCHKRHHKSIKEADESVSSS